MEDAKVLPESLLTILANMSKYKRNELPEAVVKAKEAAPMEVMNQCITLLNNSKSFEELQSVLADNKELYTKLNN
jgi:stage III sporulation protein SpoIIIAA